MYLTQEPLKICCSWTQTLTVDIDGNAWSIGGTERSETRGIPQRVQDLVNVISVSCGNSFSVFLDVEGFVWSLGKNHIGQLGLGDCNNRTVPCKVLIPAFVSSVRCGCDHTLCRDDESSILWSFGRNNHGQLGIGKKSKFCHTPQQVEQLQDIITFDCGGSHNICKNSKGELFGFGRNNENQITDTPGAPSNFHSPHKIENIPAEVTQISCGYQHTLLLTVENTVYSFGSNEFGELGKEDKKPWRDSPVRGLPPIKKIVCGSQHSICIDENNHAWGFGYGGSGQLGSGSDCRVATLDLKVPGDVKYISEGVSHHFFCVNGNDELLCIGQNNCGQLGRKGTDARNFFHHKNFNHTISIPRVSAKKSAYK